MTLLVVLGVVVVATIVAALYLSLKSGRGDELDPGDAEAGDWPARGGSTSGRSRSLAGRVRSMTGRGRAGGPSRRWSGRADDEDFDVPDYVRARRAARVADGPDRSGLVTAGADQRAATSRGAAGFDDTDPSMRPAYRATAGYDGYDASASSGPGTHVSGPLDPEPAGYGTESYRTGGYGTERYGTGGYGTERYGTGDYGTGSGRGGYRPGAEREPGRGSSRGRSAGASRDGSATGEYSSPDGYGPRRYPGPGRPGTGEQGFGPGDRDFGPEGPEGPEGYDGAPAQPTDGSFSSPAGTGSRAAEDDSRAGRRRIAKIQRPNLRRSRSRPDYDNDPWPSADEVDGISDDQFWSALSSDKPLATTARAAQDAAETDLPPGGGGRRRQDEPAQSRRGSEEGPLTSESYSRHARQAGDSRSYQGSRDAHRPSHGRPNAATDETQTMRADPLGYGAPAPRGTRRADPGGSPPPAGPRGPGGAGGPYEGGRTGRLDPYRDGPRTATAYGEGAGSYQPPARRSSRHASQPGADRPPAPNGPRRARSALPAGGGSSPGSHSSSSPSGSGSYPAAPGSGSHHQEAADGGYAGGSYPGPAGGGSPARTPGRRSPAGNGGPPYPRGGTDPAYPAANGSPAYPGGNDSRARYPGPTPSPGYPGRAYSGPDGGPGYPGGIGSPAHPGPDGSGYPQSTGNGAHRGPSGSPGYPETYGGRPNPDGAGGSAAPGGSRRPARGRRSSTRDTGQGDGRSYADPYRRADEGRYEAGR
jgi:collagen type IV alpha